MQSRNLSIFTILSQNSVAMEGDINNELWKIVKKNKVLSYHATKYKYTKYVN